MNRPAKCHPTRRAWTADGWCKRCEPRSLRRIADEAPVPLICPHCYAGPPGWTRDEDAGHCLYCGTYWDRRWVVIV